MEGTAVQDSISSKLERGQIIFFKKGTKNISGKNRSKPPQQMKWNESRMWSVIKKL